MYERGFSKTSYYQLVIIAIFAIYRNHNRNGNSKTENRFFQQIED